MRATAGDDPRRLDPEDRLDRSLSPPVAVTDHHQTSRSGGAQARTGSGSGNLAELGGDGPELLVALEKPLGPLHGLGLVLGLEDGVAADHFLGLGEGPVGVVSRPPDQVSRVPSEVG